MDGKLLFFILGACSSLLWPVLPTKEWIIPLTLLSLYLPFTAWRQKWLLAMAIWGALWMASVGYWQHYWQLPQWQIMHPVWVEGRVLSVLSDAPNQALVQEQGKGVVQTPRLRFTLALERIGADPLWLRSPKVRVSWLNPPYTLKQGNKVRLWLRLRPPHGLANQGAFHYQQWLFSEGIHATGYVRTSPDNKLLAPDVSLRQQLVDRVSALPLKQKKWLLALGLGYRGELQQHDWQWLQRTGLAHLMAISGLHLGVVAGGSFVLFVTLGRVMVMLSRRTQQSLHEPGLLFAALCALCYGYLAGFAMPTVRAWLMLCVVALGVNLHRHWCWRRLILITLTLIILLTPKSLFGLSLWLSLSAVLIITWVFWQWPRRRRGLASAAWTLVRIQLALSLFMLPLIAWQFDLIAPIAPLMNLIAVPLVTLVLLPLCLVAVLASLLGADQLWPLADTLMHWFMALLHTLSDALEGVAIATHALPGSLWLAFALIVLLSGLRPVPRDAKLVGLVLLAPFMLQPLLERPQGWRVDMLDVGHGLSVLVSKKGRAILYDTGPAYASGFNMAEAAIVPVMGKLGINQLDWLIISHQDRDHAGSAGVLASLIPIQRTLGLESPCYAGQRWQWQGLDIQVLWPAPGAVGNDNNRSCVVRIADGSHSLLLTGDIEAKAERGLLHQAGDSLRATVMTVPHHGSMTSSTPELIATVAPQMALLSRSRFNQWELPRKEVLSRYQAQGVQVLDTARDGQLTLRLTPEGLRITTFRGDWHNRWYANGVSHELSY